MFAIAKCREWFFYHGRGSGKWELAVQINNVSTQIKRRLGK